MYRYIVTILLGSFALSLSTLTRAESKDKKNTFPFKVPLGLTAPEVPGENRLTAAKTALGKLLYFDKRLSRDSTVSCATCHDPRKGWTDQQQVSEGIRGQRGARNAPTVLNSAYFETQFWDGRAASLEEQAKGPIANPVEMGFTPTEAVQRIGGIQGYKRYFKKAFGTPVVTIDRIAQSIASFERTVIGGNAPYDRYKNGAKNAIDDSAIRGQKLFFSKANCSACHNGPTFSDSDFHNLGVGMAAKEPDLGRYALTKKEADRGAFKTPALRNLNDTFPYMHDGSQKTLAEVVDFYDKGGEKNQWLDQNIRPLNLSPQEKKDLLSFLESLNGDKVEISEPAEFPK